MRPSPRPSAPASRPAARLGRRAAALLIAAPLAACTPAPPVTVPTIEAFLGVALPPGHRDLRAADEAGIDRLMRLRFDAPDRAVDAFVARLVPGGLAPGEDPALIALGAGLDWWLAALPDGGAGGETPADGRRAHKVVTAPAGPGLRRVWVAVFTL